MNHNLHKPTYQSREFYGPLELAPETPKGGDRDITVHPDNPSKLVRASGEGSYIDEADMKEQVTGLQQVLKGLSEHGVAHVNPQYIDQTGADGEPRLLVVVDRLNDVQSYEEMMSGDPNPQQITEADQTAAHMLEYATETIKSGGWVDTEMMRLDQFVYDRSQPDGKKMVLVDVEPLGAIEISAGGESILPSGIPTPGAYVVARLCADVIELAQKTDAPVSALQTAARAVEALPGNSVETDEAKAALLSALDAREVSSGVQHLAAGEMLHDEDEYAFSTDS